MDLPNLGGLPALPLGPEAYFDELCSVMNGTGGLLETARLEDIMRLLEKPLNVRDVTRLLPKFSSLSAAVVRPCTGLTAIAFCFLCPFPCSGKTGLWRPSPWPAARVSLWHA